MPKYTVRTRDWTIREYTLEAESVESAIAEYSDEGSSSVDFESGSEVLRVGLVEGVEEPAKKKPRRKRRTPAVMQQAQGASPAIGGAVAPVAVEE